MDYKKLVLLGVDEVEKLYYSSTDDEKKEIIFFCSDDLKLKESGIFALTDSDTPMFLMSFTDGDKRKSCFYQIFENSEKFVLHFAFFLGNCYSGDRKYFINLFFDYIVENSFYKFSCFEISKILKYFNANDKKLLLDSLVDILKKSSNNLGFSFTGLGELIKLFDLDKRVSIFEKFIPLKMFDISDAIDSAAIDILKELAYEDRLKFITKLLDNDLLNNSSVFSEMFECFSDEEKDLVLKFIQSYEVSNNKEVLDYEKMAFCLEKYAADIRLEKFRTLVMYSDKYDHFDVINNIVDVKFKFEAINLKIDSLYIDVFFKSYGEEKRRVLFETLNIIINNHFERWGNKVPDSNIIYDGIISFYSVYLGLNRNNLIKFINRFGYISLRYLESNSVKNLISLDSDKFDLFINLFREDNLKLDNDAYNTVINAILQREFMVQCSDDYNIFARLVGLINMSLVVELETELLNMSNVVNIKKTLLKYNLALNHFLEKLINSDSGMLDILHEITNQYIMKKREFYVKERMKTVNDELDLDKNYDKNFIKKKWIATNSLADILFELMFISDNDLTEEQLYLTNNSDILKMIIRFKKGTSGCVLEDKYKKYLKVFDSLLDILYDDDKLEDPTNDPNAKYVYSAKNIDLYNFIDLFSELDISKIDRFLLSDKKLLGSLDEILSKYKLLGWGNTFSPLKDSADFDFSNSSLVGLFDYFYNINYELMNTGDKRFSLTKMISLANCYASVSSKYGLLFGDEIYRLIAVNDGENKASMVRHKRLELGVEHLVKMYKRESVPVPPMDVDIGLCNGKKINVVVGNTTGFSNLVLGEMTNSCMRIGGAFYDFYKKCLDGKVGFNIVFTEPVTNKFVSRVSGIRNGNTIFLNELRFSEHDGYTNKDLHDLIYKVSEELINASKSSKYPIDNIVITADKVMNEYQDDLIDLHLKDRNEALFGLNHNLDAGGKAILLASSRGDGKLVDINLGRDNISYYKPQRDKVREYFGEDAIRRIVQLEMLNDLLNGVPFEDVDTDLNKDVVMCISGSDWYISKDSNGNVRKFVLDGCTDKDRALIEMSSYIVVFDEKDMIGTRGVSK